jgi:hypothetical protein
MAKVEGGSGSRPRRTRLAALERLPHGSGRGVKPGRIAAAPTPPQSRHGAGAAALPPNERRRRPLEEDDAAEKISGCDQGITE